MPEITDAETYNKLIKAVQEASQHNESIAAFKSRVEALGSAAVTLAKTVGIFV